MSDNVIKIIEKDTVIKVVPSIDKVLAIVSRGEQGPTGAAGSTIWTVLTVNTPGSTTIGTQTGLLQIEVDCSAGNVTINLPDSLTMLGNSLRIIRLDNSANRIFVPAFAGQQINFLSSYDDLYDKGECLEITAGNAHWRIV